MRPLIRVGLSMFVALSCAAWHAGLAQDVQRSAVLFENVRIFNGTSEHLSSPSNVLVVGNVVASISTAPI